MPSTIRVFVTYSHQDEKYLKKGSLLGYLKGLEREGFEFWDDRRIGLGQLWEEQIRQQIAQADLVLALVSQAFLDSPYCQDKEIREFLARGVPVLPVILSACDWQRHTWLSQRQFFPRDGRNIESHFTVKGKRQELFLEVRKAVFAEGEAIRAKRTPAVATTLANPFGQTLAIQDAASFIGRQKPLWNLNARLSGGSVALIGEPKIGKSSMLFRVREGWTQGEVLGPFDFHQLEDPDDFYAELATELDAASHKWPDLRRLLGEQKALLLLDELDAAPEIGFDSRHLARFRGVCNKNHQLRLMATCRNPPRNLFPDDGKGSQAYNMLQPVTLQAMPEDEVRHLLSHPWAPDAPVFDPATIAQLVTLGAGHPFKVQRAAFHCFHASSDPGYDWRAAWQHDLDHML